MNRALSIALVSGLALSASGQTVPPELARFVSVDSPEAVVRLVGELDSPDAEPATIEVVAPAWASVTMSQGGTTDAAASRAPSAQLLDIETDPPEGDMGAAVRYLADGTAFIVLNRDSQNLVRFDAADPAAEPTALALPHLAIGFDLTPDGTTAVTANLNDDSASVVDLATGAATTIPVGDIPGTVIVSPDGAFAVVGCGDSTLHVINLSTLAVDRVIASPDLAALISFGLESASFDYRFTTPLAFLDDTTLLVPGRFDDLLAFIDITTGARTDLALTRTDPAGLDIVGDTIVLGHATDPGYVTVVDAATRTEVRSIVTPARNNGPLALNADATRAVVSLQNAARVLNLTTDTFGPALDTANLNDVLPNFDRSRAVGIGFSGAVIDFATGNRIARANDRVSAAFGAVSPVADQAAMLSTTFGDDLVVIETDASPSLTYYGDSGPGAEGDISRHAAVSPDGAIAASSNLFSDNLSIFNTATGNQIALGTLDERPGEVEISPDGSTAVVCNLDGFVVSVVDTATGATVQVPSARRLAQVEISPDGAFAYLAQVASGDGVRKLDLATNTFVGGLTPTGNLGGVGYSYSQNSQIALNPDGTLLAVASSFTNEVILVDTTTMLVSQTLTAGSFPTRVAWSDDGDVLLAANRNDDTVSVYFDLTGTGVYAPSGTVSVGDSPFDMLVAPGNQTAFVLNWGDSNLGVINLSTLTQTATVPLPYLPMGATFNADASEIRVAGGGGTTGVVAGEFTATREGELTIIDTATLAVLDRVDTGQPNSDFAASADGTTIAYASPGADGLALVRDDTCIADTNGDGVLSPADFNGWILAFNNNTPACDQNGDGLCTPADFNGWILNFNAGCP